MGLLFQYKYLLKAFRLTLRVIASNTDLNSKKSMQSSWIVLSIFWCVPPWGKVGVVETSKMWALAAAHEQLTIIGSSSFAVNSNQSIYWQSWFIYCSHDLFLGFHNSLYLLAVMIYLLAVMIYLLAVMIYLLQPWFIYCQPLFVFIYWQSWFIY